MKTENTLENKILYLSQFIGLDAIGHECDRCNFKLTEISLTDLEIGLWGDWSGGTNPELSQNDVIGVDAVWANLKSVTDIDKGHAEYVAKVMGMHSEADGKAVISMLLNNSQFNLGSTYWAHVIQYLTRSGYSLPYLDLKQDDLIKYGWLKIV